jgi:hypothetical protein
MMYSQARQQSRKGRGTLPNIICKFHAITEKDDLSAVIYALGHKIKVLKYIVPE